MPDDPLPPEPGFEPESPRDVPAPLPPEPGAPPAPPHVESVIDDIRPPDMRPDPGAYGGDADSAEKYAQRVSMRAILIFIAALLAAGIAAVVLLRGAGGGTPAPAAATLTASPTPATSISTPEPTTAAFVPHMGVITTSSGAPQPGGPGTCGAADLTVVMGDTDGPATLAEVAGKPLVIRITTSPAGGPLDGTRATQTVSADGTAGFTFPDVKVISGMAYTVTPVSVGGAPAPRDNAPVPFVLGTC